MLGALGASLLGNLLAGKGGDGGDAGAGVIRAGERATATSEEERGTIRVGQNF